MKNVTRCLIGIFGAWAAALNVQTEAWGQWTLLDGPDWAVFLNGTGTGMLPMLMAGAVLLSALSHYFFYRHLEGRYVVTAEGSEGRLAGRAAGGGWHHRDTARHRVQSVQH